MAEEALVVALGKIGTEMRAAALAAEERAAGHGARDVHQVARLGRRPVRGRETGPLRPAVERAEQVAEAVTRALEAEPLPGCPAQALTRRTGGLPRLGRRGRRRRYRYGSRVLRHRVRRARAEDEALQQRVAGQAVRAVDAGRRHLSRRVEAGQGRA